MTLLIIIILTLLIAYVGCFFALSENQRQVIVGWAIGFMFYNGLSGGSEDVPLYYTIWYFEFLIVSIFSYIGLARLMTPSSLMVARSIKPFMHALVSENLAYKIVVMYFILSIIPLLYPTFRVMDIFHPKGPDVINSVLLRTHDTSGPIKKIIDYIRILITPFFYISLYAFLPKLNRIVFVIFILGYIDYVSRSYVSRGEFASYIGIVLIGIWSLRPNERWKIAVGLVVSLPIFLAFSTVYEQIRLGRVMGSFDFTDALLHTIESQTSFAQVAGLTVIESNYRADLGGYLLWLITLPVPKLITGSFDIARIGIEMSEIALGRPYGSSHYFALLPGLLAESFYVFDNDLFLIHGVLIGLIMAVSVAFIDKYPQAVFLHAYVMMVISYNLPRGGTGGALPLLMNSMIVLFVVFFVGYFRSKMNRLPR